MNAEELKTDLQVFYDNYEEIGVSVYAILKGSTQLPVMFTLEIPATIGMCFWNMSARCLGRRKNRHQNSAWASAVYPWTLPAKKTAF